MEKPMSLIIDEFQKKIVEAVNESRLHPSILDIVMSNMAREIHELAVQQNKQEMALYEQSLNNNAEEIEEA